eukprot:COSAG01_NODE_19003_length_1038_cov_1.000000_3_plen_86_part_00
MVLQSHIKLYSHALHAILETDFLGFLVCGGVCMVCGRGESRGAAGTDSPIGSYVPARAPHLEWLRSSVQLYKTIPKNRLSLILDL